MEAAAGIQAWVFWISLCFIQMTAGGHWREHEPTYIAAKNRESTRMNANKLP